MVIVKKFKNLYCYLLQYALASLLTWVEFYKIGSNLKKFASLSFISYSIHSRFFFFFFFFSSVQLLSCVQLFATAWTTACQAPCPSPIIGVYSNSCPLSRWFHPTTSSSVVPFSSRLQSFPVSGSFQMSVLRIRWPKCWSFSFSISLSNEYSGLISYRMVWLDLLSV